MSFSTVDTNHETLDQLLPPTYQIFVEQQHLKRVDWEETSRWVKFEENVENGSHKWSKPYLPVMSVMAVQKITEAFTYGYVLTDIDCANYFDLVNQLIAALINEGRMSPIDIQVLKEMLILPHCHQTTLTNKSNKRFESKLPGGIEAAAVLSGEIKGLVKPICIFIRLRHAVLMQELVEVAVPTKFVFVYLTNHDGDTLSIDIGRAFGALLVTEQQFLKFCYEESNLYRMNLEIDLYLRRCSILPPVWNPRTRISPDTIESNNVENFEEFGTVELQNEENCQFREDSGLVRSGRCFGGLMRDIRRKLPFYLSDFRGLLTTQVISSTLFMYFACLTALITFGGLLAKGTGNNMAAVESIVGALTNGIVYGLFSGQPLSLLGSTGPMMIYESIVYELCVALGWDYITFRFWIGMWVTLLLLVLVATDASALMSYVTRFTEESFSLVVCAIFLTTPTEYLVKIGKERVFNFMFLDYENVTYCHTNESDAVFNSTGNGTCLDFEQYDPSSFLMSFLLVIFTCAIALMLNNFKNTSFFAFKLRSIISEFAVFGTVLGMTFIDFVMGLETDKLPIPEGLSPTLPTRGWFIPPFHPDNPWYCPAAALIPAIVATILIFMNNQITISIICRKDNLLRKGVGYHLDLLLITLLIFINSFFGLPWFNTAILLSLGHLQSLRIERPPNAPGAKQQFLGHNEQRLTHLLVSILLGVSIFLAPLLKHVPLPVLYGVFLYMGVISIGKLQLIQRLLLFFMPVKYMPDYPYLRRVRNYFSLKILLPSYCIYHSQVTLSRVHIFTLAQFATFLLLWIVKSFSETALLFPVCLIIMVLARRCLDRCFTQDELRALDDLLPQTIRKRRGKSYIMANRVPTTVRRKMMVH